MNDDKTAGFRTGRRKYYDVFSHFYDAFIRLHARSDETDTRRFLVESAGLDGKTESRILDVCCGTGSVILSFAANRSDCFAVGCDFSHGMLRKAREKDTSDAASFVEGDAAELPFTDGAFDVVVCSHALYELKERSRDEALVEMKRVLKADGVVQIMEHEVPRSPLLKLLFRLRMLLIGYADARGFIEADLEPFRRIFPHVRESHSASGKSRLVSCRNNLPF